LCRYKLGGGYRYGNEGVNADRATRYNAGMFNGNKEKVWCDDRSLYDMVPGSYGCGVYYIVGLWLSHRRTLERRTTGTSESPQMCTKSPTGAAKIVTVNKHSQFDEAVAL